MNPPTSPLSPEATPTPPSLGVELLEAVTTATSGDTALSMLGTLLAAAVLVLLIRRLARRAAAAGLDPAGSLARLALIGTAAVVLGAGGLLLRALLGRAPSVAPWVLGLLALVAAAGLATVFRDFVAGLGIALRQRIRTGDRIQVGALAGRVERVGLLALRLRAPDGATIYLPTHRLQIEAIEIAHAHRGSPVEVRVHAERPLPRAVQTRIRTLAVLCPYRDPNAGLVLEGEGAGATSITVRFGVWSVAAVEPARAQLSQAIEQALTELDPTQNQR